MPLNTEQAKQAQTKSVDSRRLNRADVGKLARHAVVRALMNGDARIGLDVMKELGLLKAERKAINDSTLTEAIAMLSAAPVGATEAAAKAPAGQIEDTDSHKIFPPGSQVNDNKEDNDE